jgi:chitosanase
MQYTTDQKRAIDSVLSIFETGRTPTAASFSTCTILSDGAGISYGVHQSTDRSNSLDAIVKRYIELGGTFAAQLQPFLPYLAANKSSAEPPKGPWSQETRALINILKSAGSDPKMQQAQSEVFDRDYFMPAVNIAAQAGITTALGLLVIYDTCIHSGPGGVSTIRARFPELPPAKGGDEKAWIKAYVNARRGWLAGNSNPLVQRCVYRQDAILDLIKADNWDLVLPFSVRGVKIYT